MSAPKVRTDHQQMKEAANRFGGQAQAAQQSLQSLKGQLEVLQGGDWVGLGATAFYQEMGGQVLPAMKRLAAALESAKQTTLQIGQLMQQAETDAARVLRGEGSGDGSAAGSSGAGREAGPVAAGPAFISGIGRGPNIRAMRQAAARRQAAAERAAVEKMLSVFDPQVRALAMQSPTLRAEMLTLQKKGFMFVTGPVADGPKTVHPFITIGQPMSPADTIADIAHETGHGVNRGNEISRVEETPTMTRAQYVQLNVANNLRKEGSAQFNALQVRAELLAAGAGDIGAPGAQDVAFANVHADFAAGTITKAQAIDQMGQLMGNEKRSYDPLNRTYRDYSVDFYRADWDKYIAPTRKH
jgi:WXG100 family type VII secretion target